MQFIQTRVMPFFKKHAILMFMVALLVAVLANLWLEWEDVAQALQSSARTVTQTAQDSWALLALVCVLPLMWSLWQPLRSVLAWHVHLAGWTGIALLMLASTGEWELLLTNIVSAWVVGTALWAMCAGVLYVVRYGWSEHPVLMDTLAWAFIGVGFLVIDRWGTTEVPFLTQAIIAFLPVAGYLTGTRRGAGGASDPTC